MSQQRLPKLRFDPVSFLFLVCVWTETYWKYYGFPEFLIGLGGNASEPGVVGCGLLEGLLRSEKHENADARGEDVYEVGVRAVQNLLGSLEPFRSHPRLRSGHAVRVRIVPLINTRQSKVRSKNTSSNWIHNCFVLANNQIEQKNKLKIGMKQVQT